MHVLFLIMTLAHAAKPPVCTQDFLAYPLPIQVGSLSKPANFGERAVRPGLLRVQDDVCGCVPRRSSKWPALVKANLWVEPNQGKIRIEYIIDEERTRSIDRMLECMGEPKFSVEPMPYQTDIIYPDGRKAVLPR
jgi:hypothetical protein